MYSNYFSKYMYTEVDRSKAKVHCSQVRKSNKKRQQYCMIQECTPPHEYLPYWNNYQAVTDIKL